MFIGHYGIGLAAKNVARGPSLGTLFLAAQIIDLLWPVFLLLGIEQVLVYSGRWLPSCLLCMAQDFLVLRRLLWNRLPSVAWLNG